MPQKSILRILVTARSGGRETQLPVSLKKFRTRSTTSEDFSVINLDCPGDEGCRTRSRLQHFRARTFMYKAGDASALVMIKSHAVCSATLQHHILQLAPQKSVATKCQNKKLKMMSDLPFCCNLCPHSCSQSRSSSH